MKRQVRYLILFILTLTVLSGVFVYWGVRGRDHFAALALNGDNQWYRSYDDAIDRQMQDRDIFYHHIGHSIDEARKADIIILGHSMVLFGMRYDQLDEFAKKYHVRIYNMATAGDGSGEFIKQVITKWGLHPKLWIINADDHAASFFSKSFDDFGNFGKSSAASVIQHGFFHEYINVIGRNVSWKLDDLIAQYCQYSFCRSQFQMIANPSLRHRIWRSVVTGNWDLEYSSSYMGPGAPIKVIRDQNCHATAREISIGLSYLHDIGGKSILMLMPHSEYCPARLRELATNLGVRAIIFDPKPEYKTIDQTHMNVDGSKKFTRDFLNALAKTPEFQDIIKHQSRMALRSDSFTFCFKNRTKHPMYFHFVDGDLFHDVALAEGQTLKQAGNPSGAFCWDSQPFNQDKCPHPTAQSRYHC